MNNIVYNTKKEKLKNKLSNLNQKQFDKEILKSIGNDKLETFTMWEDPTIEELQNEIARLNKIIEEIENYIQYQMTFYSYEDNLWILGNVLKKITRTKGRR